jgi:hypothetical protein
VAVMESWLPQVIHSFIHPHSLWIRGDYCTLVLCSWVTLSHTSAHSPFQHSRICYYFHS